MRRMFRSIARCLVQLCACASPTVQLSSCASPIRRVAARSIQGRANACHEHGADTGIWRTKGGSQKARVVVHQQQLSKTCLTAFEGRCLAAERFGQQSCLAQFSRMELQQTYNTTYSGAGAKVKLADVSKALHQHIWVLKEPMPTEQDAQGRKFY